jgi:tetratricopeptide (TPR) repeat protein
MQKTSSKATTADVNSYPWLKSAIGHSPALLGDFLYTMWMQETGMYSELFGDDIAFLQTCIALGTGDDIIYMVHSNLGAFLVKKGCYAEGAKHYELAAALCSSEAGYDAEEMEDIYTCMGNAYFKANKPAAAGNAFAKAQHYRDAVAKERNTTATILR